MLCRLLAVCRGQTGEFQAHRFRDLAGLLRPGDVLVRNVTRVVPARLHAVKDSTGVECEVFLLEPESTGGWWALVRPARRLPAGTTVHLDDGTPVRDS
jgi:S-adenosylmethionine:tRNA ribosyltransferase-isomerase